MDLKKGLEWYYSDETLAKFIDGVDKIPSGICKGDLCVRVMDKKSCNSLIRNNHYSKSTATDAHTRFYFGIYHTNKLVGAMQYGLAMNPQSGANIVKHAKIEDFLELNRLWIKDGVEVHNIESQSIRLSFNLIRYLDPKVKWIQSFADGRVGVGTIYQATNFLFCGQHKQKFVKMDGREVHIGRFTNSKRSFGRMYKDKLDQFETKEYPQYRYIYFLDKKARKDLILPVLDYPKVYT